MEYRCPDASVVGPVTLENYELLFRRGGFATIAPKEGETVHGLLWSLTPGCERSLDRYEGYPRFYDKQMVTVRDSEGQSLSYRCLLCFFSIQANGRRDSRCPRRIQGGMVHCSLG